MKELTLNENIIELIEQKIGIRSFLRLWMIKNHPESSLFKEYDTDLFFHNYLKTNFTLDKKGEELLESVLGKQMLSKKVDINYKELHKKLQEELFRLTNKRQAKANGGYTFLCNEVDLSSKLSKTIVRYGLKDFEKIENLLILHINKAYKQNFDKIMLLQYYIEKNGMSVLASDYENYSEIDQKKQENQEFDGINI